MIQSKSGPNSPNLYPLAKQSSKNVTSPVPIKFTKKYEVQRPITQVKSVQNNKGAKKKEFGLKSKAKSMASPTTSHRRYVDKNETRNI